MRRGTTPTLHFTSSIDLSEFSHFWLTFKTSEQSITLKNDRITFDDTTHFSVTLTQAETLRLRGATRVQLRAATSVGVAVASNIGEVVFEEVLKEGVIS